MVQYCYRPSSGFAPDCRSLQDGVNDQHHGRSD